MTTDHLEDGALYGHRSPSGHLRRAALLLVMSILCVAAVPRIVFDVLHIRGRTDESRALAIDERRPDAERIDGVVAATEDALHTVAMLHEMAKVEGDVGVQARHALDVIGGKTR